MLESTKTILQIAILIPFMLMFSILSGKYMIYILAATVILVIVFLRLYSRNKSDESEILNVITTLSKKDKIINYNDISDEMMLRVYRDRKGYTYPGDYKKVYENYKKKGVIPFDIEVLYPFDYEDRMK